MNLKDYVTSIQDDGLIIIGGRMEDYFDNIYNSSGLILLPHTHRISFRYVFLFMESLTLEQLQQLVRFVQKD